MAGKAFLVARHAWKIVFVSVLHACFVYTSVGVCVRPLGRMRSLVQLLHEFAYLCFLTSV